MSQPSGSSLLPSIVRRKSITNALLNVSWVRAHQPGPLTRIIPRPKFSKPFKKLRKGSTGRRKRNPLEEIVSSFDQPKAFFPPSIKIFFLSQRKPCLPLTPKMKRRSVGMPMTFWGWAPGTAVLVSCCHRELVLEVSAPSWNWHISKVFFFFNEIFMTGNQVRHS